VSANNKARMRERLGVGAGGRKVVLLMGGGDGMGKLQKMVSALSQVLARAEYASQMVIVCGRNCKLASQLCSSSWPKGVALDEYTHAHAVHRVQLTESFQMICGCLLCVSEHRSEK
jgi:UDP-N-acetylglucosamine:LPS N-acetylglucosamine transferase